MSLVSNDYSLFGLQILIISIHLIIMSVNGGCRRSRAKPLLKIAKPFLSFLSRQQLPDRVDLRSYFNPIEEQYSLGSCVGNALASIYEYFHFYSTGRPKSFSQLFIYYNARLLENEISQRDATESDSGADLQFALVSLIKYGCCEEQYWPSDQRLLNVPPNQFAYLNSQNYRLNEFRRLSNDVSQLRQCLAQGYPFVMAIKIFPSFSWNHHGFIPMPSKHEKPLQYRHAVVCVGYIHSQKVFIIRNSHGIHWGDHGYGYLPYEYLKDKVLAKDLWAIKEIDNMNSMPTTNIHKSLSRHDLTYDQQIDDDGDDSTDDDDQEYFNPHPVMFYPQQY